MKLLRLGEGILPPVLQAARTLGYSITRQSKTLPDAVVLAGSTKSDVQAAGDVLSKGIPLFCATLRSTEKALDFLMKKALKHNTLVYVPFHRRVFAPFSALVQQIEQGKIGDTGFIKIHSNQPIPRGYTRSKSAPCATIIAESMVHDIDWLNHNFGPIRKVFCQGTQKSKPKTEYAMATFNLNKGVIAQVIHSWQSKVTPSLRAEICGTNGMVQYNSKDSAICQTPAPTEKEQTAQAMAELWTGHWTAFTQKVDQADLTAKTSRDYLEPGRIAQLTAQSAKTSKPYSY